MKRGFLLSILLSLGVSSFGQNNAIFYGGSGDGWSGTSYAQNSVATMYQGGAGDGWNSGSYTQSTTSALFNGGSGDGWNTSSYSQQSLATLFQGGSGDGWNYTAYLQQGSIPQFFGGSGDGWNSNNYSQTYADNAFKGGGGDGWASTYHPLSPLPISFLQFDAERKDKIALLSWEMGDDDGVVKFDVERSAEAVVFKYTGAVAQNYSANKKYRFDDVAPLSGHNYYRLKVWKKDGSYEYTGTRLVVFEQQNDGDIKVYPNPASQHVFVAVSESWKAASTVINIYDATGKLVYHEQFREAQSLFQINTSKLAAGNYFVHVAAGNNTARKMLMLAR
ncbi:MAG TPA: T9SS type A sorting domain-containing protein [Flavipsychrobacter sp.]|nr:T9SS type A sorting domain-containing protein [Flavipsychrobacter sp.]